MAEAVLGGVLVAFVAYHAWQGREWAKERQHLTHLATAKTPGEVVMMDRSIERRSRPEPKGDDFDPGYNGVLAVDS